MVKYNPTTPAPRAATLDAIFYCLSDPTRRDILENVATQERSIGDLVDRYSMSFPAVSKHIKVLEKATLVVKRKEGKNTMITLAPGALKSADEYLEQYRQMWQSRHDKLAKLLQEEK